MKLLLLLLPLMILLSSGSCKKEDVETDTTPADIELTPKSLLVIGNSNDFGVSLFGKIADDKRSDNLIISPLSASAALTMLMNGSDGNTSLQISEMLGYSTGVSVDEINQSYRSLTDQLLSVDPEVDINLANAAFYRSGFTIKPSFITTLREQFGAGAEGLDFRLPSAVEAINSWAEENTSGKITEVIDQISEETVLFLMNALYFNGSWTREFDTENTVPMPFYSDEGDEFDVMTMNGITDAKLLHSEGFSAVEIPYGRTNFSMVVIVPDNSLASFAGSFTGHLYRTITGEFDQKAEFSDVEVSMPLFSFHFEEMLNDHLKTLGMTDAFDPHVADLTGISDDDLFVEFVKQNSFIQVDERGSEAAAVTTIGIGVTSIPDPDPRFVADRPFVFLIRERISNTILFIGQVTDPS